MKAHIARNQNAGVPLVLGWNLSPADRGKLEGMAPAFGMKLLLVSPADAGKTVAQLLGEVETKAARTLVLEPGAYPPAVVLANFKEKDVDTLLDLMKQAQVTICWPTCRRSTPPLQPQRRTTPYEDPRKTFRQHPAGRGALPEPAGRLCLQKERAYPLFHRFL